MMINNWNHIAQQLALLQSWQNKNNNCLLDVKIAATQLIQSPCSTDITNINKLITKWNKYKNLNTIILFQDDNLGNLYRVYDILQKLFNNKRIKISLHKINRNKVNLLFAICCIV